MVFDKKGIHLKNFKQNYNILIINVYITQFFKYVKIT